MNRFKFVIKQMAKMILQNVILPVVYRIYARKPVKENKVILADAHHDEIPYSMENIKKYVDEKGYDVEEFFVDFGKYQAFDLFKQMVRFMKMYAGAKYVFICDNFLPIASCKKREETIVVQLWHGGGLLKKIGYDTPDDIPEMYKGNVYKNYSLVTASADCVVPVLERAMRQKKGVVQATGLSRTDSFYDTEYLEKCKKNFYKLYPEAEDKKIILWAPTFRGKADNPKIVGAEAVKKLKEEMKAEWVVITKAHPHFEKTGEVSGCPIPTEQILPVADCLITDYSSVLYDFSLLKKPMVLFVPDKDEYVNKRGLYINLDEIPAVLVEDEEKLCKGIKRALESFSADEMTEFANKYMTYCDGHATERTMEIVEKL